MKFINSTVFNMLHYVARSCKLLMSLITLFCRYFFFLLAALLALKIFLVAERTARGKWPKSLKHLRQIIEWKKEALKLLVLALIALLLSSLRPY